MRDVEVVYTPYGYGNLEVEVSSPGDADSTLRDGLKATLPEMLSVKLKNGATVSLHVSADRRGHLERLVALLYRSEDQDLLRSSENLRHRNRDYGNH